MLTLKKFMIPAVFFALGTIALVGCSNDSTTQPANQNQSSVDWKQGLDADVVKGMSELSETDRKAALEQEVCPVTGKKLGTMGKPIKVAVKGQDVFLCCSGCEDKIKNNPDKYLK